MNEIEKFKKEINKLEERIIDLEMSEINGLEKRLRDIDIILGKKELVILTLDGIPENVFRTKQEANNYCKKYNIKEKEAEFYFLQLKEYTKEAGKE